MLHVSLCGTIFSTSSSLQWTIILLVFMMVYLFSSNLSNPSTGGGISWDLCSNNSLGTFHSRHESESELPAVYSKWLESVKSHCTGLETKSSCGFDCENFPSTGLVYLDLQYMKLENMIGFSGAILESPKIVIFNLTFRVSKIGFLKVFQLLLGLEDIDLEIKFSILWVSYFWYPKS